jgi:hypothetical protein
MVELHIQTCNQDAEWHAFERMRRVPLWLKVAYTTFVVVIIRPYLRQYGWRNFLWFSDVAPRQRRHSGSKTPCSRACRP